MRKIIAFEGIDGSGKTVQINMLKEYLVATGYDVGYKEFPVYNSFFGQIIGDLLSGRGNVTAEELDPQSMALWFAMDRVQSFNKDDANDCDILLINRYVLSNAAYQSARCNCNTKKTPDEMIDWIIRLEHEELGLPVPDVYIFFDVAKNQAERNVNKKGHRDYIGDGKDIYEASDGMQSSARRAYLRCVEKFDNTERIDCMDGDRFLSVEEIHSMVLNVLVKNKIINGR